MIRTKFEEIAHNHLTLERVRTIDNDSRALFEASVIGLMTIICGGIVVGITGNGYLGVISTGIINTVNLYQAIRDR